MEYCVESMGSWTSGSVTRDASARRQRTVAVVLSGALRLLPQTFGLVARSIAGFLATFTLVNLAGGYARPGFDATIWWLDLRGWPPGLCYGFLLVAVLALGGFAVRPQMGGWRRWVTLAVVAILAGVALANLAACFELVYHGTIRAGFLLPFSGLILLGLALILGQVIRASRQRDVKPFGRWGRVTVVGGTLGVCLIGFPLALMLCFGKTDYSRRADAIVVFGARAYADGRCSDALYDRVATACALYREGKASLLVFSGGPGDGDIHETEAMARLAEKLGVPRKAILCDIHGLNTQSTVINTGAMFERRGISRVLAVSHFYHLPRVKMCYRREGLEVYTVPARERYTLTKLPYLIAREVAAFWVYYVAPLHSSS